MGKFYHIVRQSEVAVVVGLVREIAPGDAHPSSRNQINLEKLEEPAKVHFAVAAGDLFADVLHELGNSSINPDLKAQQAPPSIAGS